MLAVLSRESQVLPIHRAALWLLIPAIMAFAAMFYANRFGADVLPDSGDYITSGVRFAHDQGISMANRSGPPQPLTWFPPLFPLVIAGFESLHLPIYQSIGILQSICFAVLVWLAGMLVYRCTNQLRWALIASIAVSGNHAMYYVHSICLSEPIFLLWIVGSLWGLNRWQQSAGRFIWAMAVGVMIAGAILTRYAGASLLPAAALICLISGGIRFWLRVSSMVITGAVGAAPVAAWSWYHKPAGDTATGRHLEWHLIGWDRIHDGIETLAGFIIPDQFHPHIGNGAILLIAMAVVIAFALMWKFPAAFGGARLLSSLLRKDAQERRQSDLPDNRSFLVICQIFTFAYIAFLIVSISLFDKDTPLDERLLSPVLVPIVVVVITWLSDLSLGSAKVRRGIFAVVCILLALHVWDIRGELQHRKTRDDLAWYPTLDSETLDELKKIPQEQAVFSDKPCAIYMTSRIRTDLLPDRPPHPEADPKDSQDLKESIQLLRDKLTAEGGGWIVFWHQLDDFGDGFLTEADIRSHFVIADQTQCDDGILLLIDSPEKDPADSSSQPALPTTIQTTQR